MRPTLKVVCGSWLLEDLIKLGLPLKNAYIVEADTKYDFGKYIIEPVKAIHDAENFGYKITITKNNYKILHITDTGSVDHIKAPKYNLYCIEANYEDEELEERKQEKIKNGEFVIEDRIKATHLSKEQCMNFFMENADDNSILETLHQHINKEKKDE